MPVWGLVVGSFFLSFRGEPMKKFAQFGLVAVVVFNLLPGVVVLGVALTTLPSTTEGNIDK